MRFFGHQRPERNSAGEIVGAVASPVKVKTRGALGDNYGPDSGKRLILSCDAGDIITMRPEKTRRAVSMRAVDLYALLVRRQASLAVLERARAKKAANDYKRRFK